MIGMEQQLEYYRRMLHKQLVDDVAAEIEKEVMPKLQKKIRELATSSVAHWATSIKAQRDTVNNPFQNADQISVTFVEEVLNKVVSAEPEIKIQVKEEKR